MLGTSNSSRYTIPTAESFRGPIGDDDFEIRLAKTDEEKQLLIDARASKLWRTLRIASKGKLNLFDKIDDGNKLDALFEPEGDESKEKEVDGMEDSQEQSNRESTPLPIVTEKAAASKDRMEAVQEAHIK